MRELGIHLTSAAMLPIRLLDIQSMVNSNEAPILVSRL